MNSTIAEAAGESPREGVLPAAKPIATQLGMLVRRELWEHRYLWIAPLALAGLLTLLAVIGRVHFGMHDEAALADPQQRVAWFTIVVWALSVPFYVLSLFIVGYYLLDCLYAERKDRSILFWKSLPVSDGLTVLAKLLVALLVVPLGVFALGVLTNLAVIAVLRLRIAMGNVPMLLSWSTLEWARTELALLAAQCITLLWHAPVAGYLLVISAWARRSPFLWATLPLVMAPILERIAFGTHHLWDFILYRFGGIWHTLGVEHANLVSRNSARPVGTLLQVLDFRAAFTDIDLWLGLAAAAALVFAAIRIRRYRDDT